LAKTHSSVAREFRAVGVDRFLVGPEHRVELGAVDSHPTVALRDFGFGNGPGRFGHDRSGGLKRLALRLQPPVERCERRLGLFVGRRRSDQSLDRREQRFLHQTVERFEIDGGAGFGRRVKSVLERDTVRFARRNQALVGVALDVLVDQPVAHAETKRLDCVEEPPETRPVLGPVHARSRGVLAEKIRVVRAVGAVHRRLVGVACLGELVERLRERKPRAGNGLENLFGETGRGGFREGGLDRGLDGALPVLGREIADAQARGEAHDILAEPRAGDFLRGAAGFGHRGGHTRAHGLYDFRELLPFRATVNGLRNGGHDLRSDLDFGTAFARAERDAGNRFAVVGARDGVRAVTLRDVAVVLHDVVAALRLELGFFEEVAREGRVEKATEPAVGRSGLALLDARDRGDEFGAEFDRRLAAHGQAVGGHEGDEREFGDLEALLVRKRLHERGREAPHHLRGEVKVGVAERFFVLARLMRDHRDVRTVRRLGFELRHDDEVRKALLVHEARDPF